MMRAVVTEGSGSLLAGLPGAVGAKTGTAEYGSPGEDGAGAGALPTHAWMIATQGDLAVAVFVETGESGSQSAGPLLLELPPGLRPRRTSYREAAAATSRYDVCRVDGPCDLCHAPGHDVPDAPALPSRRTLDEPLAHWAKENPDGEAVLYGERTLDVERVERPGAPGGRRPQRPRRRQGRRRGVPRQEPPGVRRDHAGRRLARRRARDRQLALGRRRGRLRRQRLRREGAVRRRGADAHDREDPRTG